MGRLFGPQWADFCSRHSRFYARARGLAVSKLRVADKLAFVLTPAWLYLPLARASGELWECMERSRERQAGGKHFTDEEWAGVTSTDPRMWLRALQSHTHRWVQKHHRLADELPVIDAEFVERFQMD
jgi:hypothetical protein